MTYDRLLAADTVIDLAEHMTRLKEAAAEFHRQNSVRERGFFTPREDDQVVHLWVSYHMARNALFDLIYKIQTDKAINEVELADFAIAYAAAVILVDAARYLRELFADESIIRRKLNESYGLYGIDECSFDAIQMSLSDPAHAIQLYQASRYFDERRPQLLSSVGSDPQLLKVLNIIEALDVRLRVSPTDYVMTRAKDRAKNLYELLVHGAIGQAVYVIQSWVSERIGKLSTRPDHRPALPEEVKSSLHALLQPGDVLVTRKEHSLTNYFLPGYWPHVAMYIGEGHVIEALADGVRLRALASPFAVDAIATIRPQLTVDQIDEAIERAHTHVGKPYDFDFDFTRADRMVCTEVVYRSYEGIGPMQFQLTVRAGRQTLSAEDLLNLSRRRNNFHPVAAFCPHHLAQLLVDEPQVDALLAATVQTGGV